MSTHKVKNHDVAETAETGNSMHVVSLTSLFSHIDYHWKHSQMGHQFALCVLCDVRYRLLPQPIACGAEDQERKNGELEPCGVWCGVRSGSKMTAT